MFIVAKLQPQLSYDNMGNSYNNRIDLWVRPALLLDPDRTHLVPSREIHMVPAGSLDLAPKPHRKGFACFLSALYPDMWGLCDTTWFHPSGHLHVAFPIYI